LLAADFDAHLDAVANAGTEAALAVGGRVDAPNESADSVRVLLTFDDGGTSALDIADRLERRGWRGHFFMATDYIGTRGFLTVPGLKELHGRGHVVGSHSCSHPLRMGACSRSQLDREWRESVARLADLLGEATTVASVPGGYFTTAVGAAAAEAGIRFLFTSEPTTQPMDIGGCRVLGRFTLRRDDPAKLAAALITPAPFARARQWAHWNVKKLAKRIGGPAYLKARALVIHD
jgi:peptidoglycan/xylan/chitin deacetylase (PgdA/CDA1 family)